MPNAHACDAPPVPGYRLLGHPKDLPGYLRALGPLPLPSGRDRQWAESLRGALESSGLTGRGGAGFPTSVKLGLAQAGRGHGVVVVNAMEGEPASDKDKLLLITVPHLVLDGAQLLAAACGADQVLVCVPSGRDVVADAVQAAIAERQAQSYARIDEGVVRPPSRFVAGEESALVQWIDSGLSHPTFRPDKSVALRIGRKRALVHNTETLAHVGLIARRGPDAFRSRGLSEEPGTTLVTISGAVAQPGVVEVDRGTSLRAIVGRADPAEPLAALLVGGYGGVWVGPEHFDMPYASFWLRTIGASASAGVGVVVALGAATCGIAETARLAHYLAGQSSGQCGPCVYGLPAVAEDLTLLAYGRSDPGLMARLHRRVEHVDGRGGCRHPDGAVGMVRSALGVFAADVASHQQGVPCAHVGAASQLRARRD